VMMCYDIGNYHGIPMSWRVPEQSQAKNLPYFLATLPLYRFMSVFSSLIEPVSTIAVPDSQSSA